MNLWPELPRITKDTRTTHRASSHILLPFVINLALIITPLCISLSHSSPQPLPMRGFSDIVKAVSPAVVFITSQGTEQPQNETDRGPGDISQPPPFPFHPDQQYPFPFQPPEPFPQERSGSGILIDPAGYIVTNNHVVEGAKEVTVRLSDRREFTGTIVGTDPQTDLAVIAIKGENLPSMKWSDSDRLEVGDLVLAIGSPFGLTQTVTMGIVSALGRGDVGIAEYEDFIQTDAAINPGNSGGALVNMEGALVGINTAIFSRTGGSEGIGFAIASNIAQHIVTSLLNTGTVVRGWLGVSIQDVTPALAEAFGLQGTQGALVAQVLDGSPAEEAGLQQGDIIVKYAGKTIDNVSQVRNAAAQTQVGAKVEVDVIRDGQIHTIPVMVAERPTDLAATGGVFSDSDEELDNVLADFRVRDLNPETLQRLELGTDVKGAFVEAVRPESPADREGLRRGDIIQQIRAGGTQHAISNAEDFEHVARTIDKDEMVILLIQRRGGSLFIPIKPKP